jgi:hypothetical protein
MQRCKILVNVILFEVTWLISQASVQAALSRTGEVDRKPFFVGVIAVILYGQCA